MTTEITNQVLERQVKLAKIALDTHDAVIAQHERKLAHQQTERLKTVAQLDALVGDFPALQRVVDEHDAAKVPLPPPAEPVEPLLTAKVRR